MRESSCAICKGVVGRRGAKGREASECEEKADVMGGKGRAERGGAGECEIYGIRLEGTQRIKIRADTEREGGGEKCREKEGARESESDDGIDSDISLQNNEE